MKINDNKPMSNKPIFYIISALIIGGIILGAIAILVVRLKEESKKGIIPSNTNQSNITR